MKIAAGETVYQGRQTICHCQPEPGETLTIQDKQCALYQTLIDRSRPIRECRRLLLDGVSASRAAPHTHSRCKLLLLAYVFFSVERTCSRSTAICACWSNFHVRSSRFIWRLTAGQEGLCPNLGEAMRVTNPGQMPPVRYPPVIYPLRSNAP